MSKRKHEIDKGQLRINLNSSDIPSRSYQDKGEDLNSDSLTKDQMEVLNKYGINVEILNTDIDNAPSPYRAFCRRNISDEDYLKYCSLGDHKESEPIEDIGDDGIYVNRIDRAKDLLKSLTEVNHANMLVGLEKAYKKGIKQDSKISISKTAPDLGEKIDEHMKASELAFYRACGYNVLRSVGVKYVEELGHSPEDEYNVFLKKYNYIPKSEDKSENERQKISKRELAKFRRKLKKQIPIDDIL